MSIACLCVGLAAISSTVRADDTAAAKAKYESGVRHFDLSEYDPALADFKDAYRSKPDPALLYNIAQCHRKLGHTNEAITFYQTYLRRAPDARNREEVERRISELQAARNAESSLRATGTNDTAQPRTPTVEAVTIPTASPPLVAAPLVPAARPVQPPLNSAFDVGAHQETGLAPAAPIYKRWWFWTAVGAVAAGAATVAIIMARRDPTNIPDSSLGSQRAMP
jgi:tetratricopeptide (TPR) repeat protein